MVDNNLNSVFNLFDSSFNIMWIFVLVFIFILILIFLTSLIANKKNGVKVVATIKSITKTDFDDDNVVNYNEPTIICSCDYEGVGEAKLFYNYKTNYNELKVGDTIECIYNKKGNYFMTESNMKGVGLMIVILSIVFLGFCAFFFFNYFLGTIING